MIWRERDRERQLDQIIQAIGSLQERKKSQICFLNSEVAFNCIGGGIPSELKKLSKEDYKQ